MPLLLYCVALETATDTAVSGVGGAAVCSKVEGGLRFFYSETEGMGVSSRDVVAAAQAVHAVVSDIFSQGAVLPFQYPTVVDNEGEIAKLSEERGAGFGRFLEFIGNKVQMDVRLTMTDDVAARQENPHSPAGVGQPLAWPQPSTGTAYLQARAERQASLSAAAVTCRLAAHPVDWRVLPKGENIRCQALIERVEVVSFLERMRTLELPAGVRAAISGPWPPAGFWDEPR